MPTAQELAALTARVEALERALGCSPSKTSRPAPQPKAAGAATPRKKR
jgi:BMFP domain-containing protein YqiC